MNSAGRYMGRPEMRDTDYCITTRELAAWIKQKQIDFDALEDSKFDSMFGSASGGGNIFGNSGGVMESALRTLYYLETGEEAGEEFLNFEPVRGLEGVKEASLSLHNDIIHVAAISGLMNARKFLNKLEERHSWKNIPLLKSWRVLADASAEEDSQGPKYRRLFPQNVLALLLFMQWISVIPFTQVGRICGFRISMMNFWKIHLAKSRYSCCTPIMSISTIC